MFDFEDDYVNFDNKLGTKHWSPYKRIKRLLEVIYYDIKNKKNRLKLKEVSRDKFLKQKTKDRNKIIRIYLIKGLINWISYKFYKKIIFKEIKELKTQKIYINLSNYRKYKYILTNINSEIHITERLSKVPPQLWLLLIIYDYYYKVIIFYFIKKEEPIYHKEPTPVVKNRYMKWKINPFYGKWGLYQIHIISFLLTMIDGGKYNYHLSRQPINLIKKYYLLMLERSGIETWSSEKSWFDISSIFTNLYDSHKKELIYEGKEKPEGILIDKDMSEYKYDWDLLLRKFETERRLKSAFMLHLAIHSQEISHYLHTAATFDPTFLEKAEMFAYFETEYRDDIGYVEWVDLHDRLYTRWRYERHIIHIEDICGIFDDFIKIEEIRNILDVITVIYYDITIVELISSLKLYMNWKQKEAYFELIDIQMEPSLKIYINYDQYDWKEFEYWTNGGKMEISKELNEWFNKHNLDRRRNITFKTMKDTTADCFSKFVYASMYYVQTYSFKYPTSEYDSRIAKERLEILRKYKPNDYVEKIFVEADLLYIWDRTISGRFSDSPILLEEKQIIFELNYLKLKWNESGEYWDNAILQNKLEEPLIFVNMLKVTWEQYLHLDITEKEILKLYKKNTVLFNEKYNLWYLKLMPIRVKLPIELKYNPKILRCITRPKKKKDIDYYYILDLYLDHIWKS